MKARALQWDYVCATTLRLVTAEQERCNAFLDGRRGHTMAQGSDGWWSFAHHHKLSRYDTLSAFETELRVALSPRSA